MSDIEKQKMDENKVEVVKNENQDNSQILSFLKKFDERLSNIENRKFSRDEIKDIAEKNVIEREVKFEQEILETKKIQDLQLKSKTDLEIRNQMLDLLTYQFLNGEVAPSFFKTIASNFSSGNQNNQQLLAASLFWYLAPNSGISQDYLRNTSLLQMESDFNRGNNFGNIIRNFKIR